MKKVLMITLKTFLILVVAIVIASTANAQPNPGGPGTNGGNQGSGPTNDFGNQLPNVPFDGGMSLMLLASGIGYGVKKLKKK